MPSMQALFYLEPHRLEWREIPLPTLVTGEDALVRPLAVARCDLDLAIALGGYRTPGPFQLGHEIAAEVVEVGDRVRSIEPGERVIVPFQINCGTCSNCRRGFTNACRREAPCAAFGLGTHPDGDYGGGLSDLVRVPWADAMLLPLAESLTPEAACGLSDNVADGFRTVGPALARFPDEPVLVVGGRARSVGLYAVAAAVALGAPRVVYVDDDEQALRLAGSAGAETRRARFDEAPEETFLIVADASATEAGLAWALRSTAPCGFLTGVFGERWTLDLGPAYLRGVHYTLERVQSRASLPDVLACVHEHGLDPLAVEPVRTSFAEATEAMFDPAVKVIFTP